MSKNKKSKNKKIGKVNPIFYTVAQFFVRLAFTKKYNITYDNDIAKDIADSIEAQPMRAELA